MFLTKSGIVWSARKALHNILHMKRYVVKPLTHLENWGHDVLLDTAHDLLKING